jgi:hypothetical protein
VSEQPELTLRPPRTGDVPALVRIHREFAASYLELAPASFQMPDPEGLPAYVEGELNAGEDTLELVAEADGEVVGALWARIVPPHPDARYARRDDCSLRHLRWQPALGAVLERAHGLSHALAAPGQAARLSRGRLPGKDEAHAVVHRGEGRRRGLARLVRADRQ